MFPLNTIIAWSINIIMNKKYDNNNIIIASRAYFLQQPVSLLLSLPRRNNTHVRQKYACPREDLLVDNSTCLPTPLLMAWATWWRMVGATQACLGGASASHVHAKAFTRLYWKVYVESRDGGAAFGDGS
jgi:hypothetical protein